MYYKSDAECSLQYTLTDALWVVTERVVSARSRRLLALRTVENKRILSVCRMVVVCGARLTPTSANYYRCDCACYYYPQPCVCFARVVLSLVLSLCVRMCVCVRALVLVPCMSGAPSCGAPHESAEPPFRPVRKPFGHAWAKIVIRFVMSSSLFWRGITTRERALVTAAGREDRRGN